MPSPRSTARYTSASHRITYSIYSPKMCKQQHCYFTQCDHWVRRFFICLERIISNCRQESVIELHYDAHCQACIAHKKHPPKALQQLKLTDRFPSQHGPAEKPAFASVEYDTSREPSSDKYKSSPTTARSNPEVDDHTSNSTFSVPNSPPMSPTSLPD